MATIGKTNPHAKHLRRQSTDAEQRLWHHLRSRQLHDLKFRRQATVGPYIVDFLCVEARLVIEADGGQHSEARDAARTQFVQSRGFRVLRFWNHDILQNVDGVLMTIAAAAKKGVEEVPSPNPLPQAGEG